MTTFRPLPGAQPGAQASPAGGLDMTTFKPLNAAPGATPPRPQPAQDAIAGELGTPTTPGAAEGTYTMHTPSGHVIPVRYSRVHQALDQGLLFADQQNLRNYARDHATDPLDEDRIDQWLDKHPYVAAPVNLGKGLGIGLAKTLTGVLPTPTTRAGTEMQMLAATPPKGAMQETGEVGENLAEFFSGEELLSMLGKTGAALSMADKLKTVTGLAQLIDKVPMVGKLLKIGASAAKQGTIAGTQTLAKTGSPSAALWSGGIAAATGGAFQAAGEGLSSAIAKRATTLEDVGGVETPVPAAARNVKPTPAQAAGQESIRKAAQSAGRAHLEEVNEGRAIPPSAPALPARTGPFEFKLRGAPEPTETNTGNLTTRAAEIPRTHTSLPTDRAGATEYSRVGTEPEYIRPGDTFAERQGRVWAERRIPGAMHSSAPGETPMESTLGGGGEITTQDPNLARAHIETLNRAIEDPSFARMPEAQQQDLLAARADAQQQMTRYHAEVLQTLPGYGKANFAPVDIPQAVAKIGSWSDTAQAVKQTAVDGYKTIMDGLAFTGESPQHLTMIRNAYQAAEAKFMEADNPAALSAAEQSIEKTHDELRAMLGRVPNAASVKEFAAMNDAYKNGLGLEKISKAIDGSFHAPMSSAKRSFEYSGYNGQQLLQRMEGLMNTMGRGRVTRLMGKENLDTVLQVGQLSSTNAGRMKLGAALKAVSDGFVRLHVGPMAVGAYVGRLAGVPWEFAAPAGAAAAEGGKRLMNVILTNPKIAQNLIFAIDSGAKPENYGPFIATMIQRAVTESGRKQQQGEGQAPEWEQQPGGSYKINPQQPVVPALGKP
jgi:hypothetical protein